MGITARHDLSVWRNDDSCEIPIRVRGLDLTDATMVMEVRLAPDTPGAPLIRLEKVTNGNAEGLRVAGVETVGGVPETDLRIRINKSTRTALPYAGEVGDAARLSYAFVLYGVSTLVGDFVVLASPYASDNAPAGRAGDGATADASYPAAGALLTVTTGAAAVVTIDGVGLLGPIVERAEEAAAAAQALVGSVPPGLTYTGVAATTGVANEWSLQLPAGITYIDDARYEIVAPATPSGPLKLGPFPVLLDNGAPATAASGIREGWAFTVRFDGGNANVWRLLSSAYDGPRLSAGLTQRDDPLATFRQAIVDFPLGTNPGSGAVVPWNRRIVGRGSSVSTDKPGRDGGVYEGPAPIDYLVAELNKVAPGVQYQADNWGHGGHVVNQSAAQLAEAAPGYMAVFDAFLMNDGKPANFNAQEVAGDLAIRFYYYQDCRAICLAGHTLFLCTTMHPHRGRAPADMDGIAQSWPVNRPAPVAPENMFPPRSKSLIVKDWTGGGVPVVGDVRYGIVNDLLRDVARRLHSEFPGQVILLDAEWASFRYVVEPNTVAPGTVDWSGYDVMYPGAEVYHPAGVGHRGGYGRPIDDFIAACRGGAGSQWTFRGDAA